ncbi:L,D-transpeptidase family protein [Sporolituus thermophilus]|uniref:Peptidoglycan binding domain-containing protein n=1 Tax=Sporolituus thermophilus DSM 23256 TaxID=1123285 RepID=A0A1G7HHY3_9FIRM|nr:L,D-transpeptidase family protein [Sporolituus thermophilus]SDE99961.1 Putative peptidoglycan binding domain-containing protein [Sporolituus thermophilus DSM 23256]
MKKSLAGREKKFFFGLVFVLLLGLLLVSYEVYDELDLSLAEKQAAKPPPSGEISITIKLNSRLLELYSDGQLYKKYRIAVGKRESPSPVGEWIIKDKFYSPKEILGTRWLSLDVPWGSYGIHGTNRPWSIGQFASKGCIRLRNADIEELYEWVPVNTPVKIIGNRTRVLRELKLHSVGPDVVSLQLRLQQLGFFGGRADGRFGKATEEALRNYQQENGLEPTGVADKKTIRALNL